MKTFLGIYGFLQLATMLWMIYASVISKQNYENRKLTIKEWWKQTGFSMFLLGCFFALLFSIATCVVYSVFSVFADL